MAAASVAPRHCPKGLELASDRRSEPLLAAHVGHKEHVMRRAHLVGAVRTPELLQHLLC